CFLSHGLRSLRSIGIPCGSSDRLDSIREPPDRRMLASPRSLSQLTAPFVAIPSQSHPPYGVVVSDDFNIPGGCLREPYAWQHRGGRSRKRLPPPLALRVALIMRRCIIR